MNTNLGIIQYIKTGEVSIEYEINNIKAGQDIDIRIRQFLMNSPDYQILQQEINRKKAQAIQEQEVESKQHLLEGLDNLLKLEKSFKIDVLQLAKVFSKLEIRTERLQKARALFDQGRFKEADQMLVETDLYEDLFNLLTLADFWENRQKSLVHEIFNPNAQ